ncbi:MAG: nucleotide exchange factor GrpE [Eubacteriales bacterium]
MKDDKKKNTSADETVKENTTAAGKDAADGDNAQTAPSETKNGGNDAAPSGEKTGESEIDMKKNAKKVKNELDKLAKDYDELNDKYMRMIAEYDNFRKRAKSDREAAYNDAANDIFKELLPVVDNLERAAALTPEDSDDKTAQGVRLTLKSFSDALSKLGVEVISREGEAFDPTLENAVMHIEDEKYGENTVVSVFQKGYKKGDKVLRFAMVQVAN